MLACREADRRQGHSVHADNQTADCPAPPSREGSHFATVSVRLHPLRASRSLRFTASRGRTSRRCSCGLEPTLTARERETARGTVIRHDGPPTGGHASVSPRSLPACCVKRQADRPRVYRPSFSERSEWVANSRKAGTLDIRFENVPDAVIRPSFMKKTTSHRRTDARRWATTKMVLAPASA